MTRFDDPLFDPRLADWLEEDPSTAPEQALEIVLASLPSIKQRRAMRVPWRTRDMTSIVRLGLAAAVVVAATLGGIYFVGSRNEPSIAAPATTAPAPTPTPGASPSEAPASPAPSSTPAGNLSTFSSPQYGYTVRHPTAFQVSPATEPWPSGGVVGTEEPWVDRFFAPFGGTAFVGIASQVLPDGTDPADWIADYERQVASRGCPVPLNAWADDTVDGAPARRALFRCGDSSAVELAWVAGETGWVMTGNADVVDLLLESFEHE